MLHRSKTLYVLATLIIIAILSACGASPEPAAPAPAEKAPAEASSNNEAVAEPIEVKLAEGCDALPYNKLDDVMVDTSQYKKAPPWTIGFSNTGLGDSWLVFMVQHLEWRASCYPDLIKEVIVTDAESKPDKQLSDVETLLAKGIDLLIINPATDAALNPAVERAMEEGVPVVVVVRSVTTDQYVTFIESQSYQLGVEQAEWIDEAISDKGNIVMMSGIAGAGSAEDRLRGANDYFAEHPDINILAHAYTEWSPVKGKQIMENWLQAYDQIDAVWCDSGLQCSGAAEAFMAAGKEVPPLVMEDFNMALKLWKEHNFTAKGFSYPTWMSAVAVDLAVDILQGKEVPKKIDVPRTAITQETLDDYVRTDKPDDFWADNKLPEEWLPGGAN